MIDLHMHSLFSDGSYTPEALVEAGAGQGLKAMALTDHETTAGVGRFLAACRKHGLRGLPAVEIESDFRPGALHLLGYFIDPRSGVLHEHLDWMRRGRDARNREIHHLLNAHGCHLTWAEVAAIAGDEPVGREHFAAALVRRGHAASLEEALDLYLSHGRPAYASRRRLSPASCIELIRQSGGVPVLAHPFTLRLPHRDLRRALYRLRDVGLEGLEVYYPEHNPEMTGLYGRLARDTGLARSGGSDFHGARAPEIALGKGFGNLAVPDEVLSDLESRIPDR